MLSWKFRIQVFDEVSGVLRTSLDVKFDSWSIGDIYFWIRNLLLGQIHDLYQNLGSETPAPASKSVGDSEKLPIASERLISIRSCNTW